MSCLHVSKRKNCTAGLFRAVSLWGFRDKAESCPGRNDGFIFELVSFNVEGELRIALA